MRIALATFAIVVFVAACGAGSTSPRNRTSPTPSPTLSSLAISNACQAQNELEAAIEAIEVHSGTASGTADNLLFIRGDWVTAAGYAHDDKLQIYAEQYLGISDDIDNLEAALSGSSTAIQGAISKIQTDLAGLPRLACP